MTNPHPLTEVEVTQADRDRLAARYRELSQPGMADEIVAGEQDDHPTLIMLARHRIEHSTPDRNAVLEEAVEAAFNASWALPCDIGDIPVFIAELEKRGVKAALTTTPEPTDPAEATFQQRVQPWMMACFGPEIAADKLERNDRFIEEALELVQASEYPKERALALVEYVYGRDQGEINQEVGGVMVTLAAHCLAHGVDMHDAGETELARIWTKVDQIRAKQAAKPTGSALPIPTDPAGVSK